LLTFWYFKGDAFEEMAQAELHRFEQGVMEETKKSLSLLWIAVPLEHAGFKILCSVDLEMGFR
jgi:hypothetical protein